MRQSLMLFVIGVVIIAGCVSNAIYLNQPFDLRLGQTAVIENENINIRFMTVAEDSRCPSDVQCIQEGRAVVVVNIVKDGENLGDFTLASNEPPIIFDLYSIELVDVKPYPISTQRLDTSAYVITLVVSKN